MNERIAEITVLGASALLMIAGFAFGLPWIAIAFFICLGLAIAGYAMGQRLIPDRSVWIATPWGFFAVLGFLMLIRGAWFYLGLNLNGWGDVVPVAVTLLAAATWVAADGSGAQREEGRPPTSELRRAGRARGAGRGTMIVVAVSTAISLLACALIAFAANRASVTDAIRTPWPLMPTWTLLLIGLLWTLALSVAWKFQSKIATAIQICAAFAGTLTIAPLLYRIGYGFDGFLHVAGERVLLNTGMLIPKPPYYMGQYVFTTWLSKLFEIDISLIDRWLVPVAAILLIPAALALIIKKKEEAPWLIALILIPLSPFIATTPHGFATVLAVTALLLCIRPCTHPAVPILIACWSALTHPLVGLPILLAVLASTLTRRTTHYALRTTLSWTFAILSGFSIPIVFGLASMIGSSAGVSFDLTNVFAAASWKPLVASWIPWVNNAFAIWPETAVWIEKLLPFITMLFAGLALFRIRKDKEIQPVWMVAALSAATAATILQLAGDFNFLIDYERGNYASRLWLVAQLMLLPLAIPEFGKRLEAAKNGAFASTIALLLAVGLLGAGASYAALPRHDAVTPSRGWSVGASDIEAVKLIDQDAAGETYTVLANQSVSAAAVRTFGFKRYNNDVFFYPIPTGGDLYKVFLKASYESPSRDTMNEAANLGDSSLVYFVVNDYWWKAPELIEQARATADRTFVIGDGKVVIFKYLIK